MFIMLKICFKKIRENWLKNKELFLYCYKKKRSSKEDNGPSDLGIAE